MHLEPGLLALVNFGNRLGVDVIDHVEIDRNRVNVQFQVNGWSSVNRVVATRYCCPGDSQAHWVDCNGDEIDDFAGFYWGPSDVR